MIDQVAQGFVQLRICSAPLMHWFDVVTAPQLPGPRVLQANMAQI